MTAFQYFLTSYRVESTQRANISGTGPHGGAFHPTPSSHQLAADANKVKHIRSRASNNSPVSKPLHPTRVWDISKLTFEDNIEKLGHGRANAKLRMVIYQDDLDIDGVEDCQNVSDERLHTEPRLSATLNVGSRKGLMRVFTLWGPCTAPNNDEKQIAKCQHVWKYRDTGCSFTIEEDEDYEEAMFLGFETKRR